MLPAAVFANREAQTFQDVARGEWRCARWVVRRLEARRSFTRPAAWARLPLSAAALEKVAPSRTQPGPFTGGIYSHDFYLAPTLEQAFGSVLIQAGKGDLPEDQRPDAVRALLARPGVALYLEGC